MSDIEKSSSEQAIAKESQQENARQERIAMFGVDILDPVNWTTYQSNKIVKSIPMTRELYNRYRDFPQVEGENPNDEGYLIEYTDGGKPNHPHHENYISWSPKDVFDRNHSLPVKKGRGLTPHIAVIDEAGWYCDEVKRERIAPSFTHVTRQYGDHFKSVASRLPRDFTGEVLLELLKETAPVGLEENLYYAPGDTCYSIGLRGYDRIVFIKDADENTIRFNGTEDKESKTHVKENETMSDLFTTFFEILFPIGSVSK